MAQALPETEGPRSKRALILTAAIDRFGQDGYEHTKWAEVADQVGIGQTALYHYFESKAHCLLTIMSLELDRSLEKFREATAAAPGAREALEAAIAAAYDVTPREVSQMRILQSHMDLLATPRPSEKEEAERQRSRELVRQIESEWTALLQRGIKAKEFPKRDPHAIATVVLAMIVSVWRWYRPGGRMTLDEVRELITGACLRVVGP
ncbi:TetR family transcriptional regulator [Nocardioides bizhenqiangii]|uniref:TetR family transcriptional regulator n=1 Tax=Nocardioides bizhenqiangii TaxID=3095076 RepID=A0ABZ0ZXR0_9ACTN|nr:MULTISPECIES: TetR family transcriptional regulator [unclassified Nocardioides]MDZ5622371.1 TetR family transcriptional regulator [Nocardioides sp. HM23]WQQ28461.1 TetR family transcriptional regulator [Nocardioides sp. HM61]